MALRSYRFGPDGNAEARRSSILAHGPIIPLQIASARPPADANELSPGFVPRTMTVKALLDTGASLNGIDSELAQSLGLAIVDRRFASSGLGSGMTDIYLGDLRIPALESKIGERLFGLSLGGPNSHFQLLLGRPFLQDFIFRYDGLEGEFYLETPDYRSPSDTA